MNEFVIPQANVQAFQYNFSQWMTKTFTPFQRLEHPDLKAALACLGVSPPSRKAAASVHLEKSYASTLERTVNLVKASKSVGVSMDGWKKRSAVGGSPLVTTSLLLPDGGAVFWKVNYNYGSFQLDR
jgi:hypothetical protein